MVIKEFDRDPQRYINLALQSDKRIQMLMTAFIFDNIVNRDVLLKAINMIPRQIILDLKNANKLQEQFDIQDFMSKYDLIDSDYSITMGSKWINPNEAIKQFVEDNSVANIRQSRLSELGL